MAARDPVLEELMRNGGRVAAEVKKDSLGATSSSTQSLELKGEDIGEWIDQ